MVGRRTYQNKNRKGTTRPDRRLIPAQMIEHTSELRRRWMGRRARRLTERAKRATHTSKGVWTRRGGAAKGPFAGPNSETATPRHVSIATAAGRNVSRASRNSGSASGRRLADRRKTRCLCMERRAPYTTYANLAVKPRWKQRPCAVCMR
jgi:hypothetical protein